MKKKKKAQILQPHPQQPRGAPVANFLSPASWAHLGLLTPVPPLLTLLLPASARGDGPTQAETFIRQDLAGTQKTFTTPWD